MRRVSREPKASMGISNTEAATGSRGPRPGPAVVDDHVTAAQLTKWRPTFGYFVADQPILARDRVRYVGDPVAAVVAEAEFAAGEAAALLAIRYEPPPFV